MLTTYALCLRVTGGSFPTAGGLSVLSAMIAGTQWQKKRGVRLLSAVLSGVTTSDTVDTEANGATRQLRKGRIQVVWRWNVQLYALLRRTLFDLQCQDAFRKSRRGTDRATFRVVGR